MAPAGSAARTAAARSRRAAVSYTYAHTGTGRRRSAATTRSGGRMQRIPDGHVPVTRAGQTHPDECLVRYPRGGESGVVGAVAVVGLVDDGPDRPPRGVLVDAVRVAEPDDELSEVRLQRRVADLRAQH